MTVQPRSREQDRKLPRERVQRLAEVARRVRDDALEQPRRTLETSEVPAGGE